VDNNHTVKKIGDRYRVFINLGNGWQFPLYGEHATPETAEAAYARWQSDDKDKRDYRVQVQPFEGTWG